MKNVATVSRFTIAALGARLKACNMVVVTSELQLTLTESTRSVDVFSIMTKTGK